MACVEDLCSFYLTLHFLKCLIALQAFCGGGEVVGWALTLQIQCFLRKICTALHRMTENAGCSRLFLSCPDLISSSRNRSILKPSEKYVTQCCNQGGPSLCHAQRRAWCFSPAWKCASEHRVPPFTHSTDDALWLMMLHLPRISPSVFWQLGNPWGKSYGCWRGEGNMCGNLSALQDFFGIHTHLQECTPSILYCY